jgi:hypothetical protein
VRGASSVYCTTFESYDPADPNNAAKWGRAVHPNRPVINTGHNSQDLVGGGGLHPDQPPNNIAFQGLDLNPGAPLGMSFIPGNGVLNGNILIENCVCREIAWAMQNNGQYGTAGIGGWLIVRNCAWYGVWAPGGSTSHLYIDGFKHVTLEDSVFAHSGWKMGASRDDSVAVGGADTSGRSHPYYLQEDCNSTITRRCLIIDPVGDAGQNRSSSLVYDNVLIDPPIAASLGSGAAYWVTKPFGVDIDYSYNFVLGDADLNSTNLRRWFIASVNGTSISRAYANTAVKSNNISGTNNSVFSTSVQSPNAEALGTPSYMTYSYNYTGGRSTPGRVFYDQSTPGGSVYAHASYDHNVWDETASGTNINTASSTPAHAYTAADIYGALGFADKAALTAYVINHPEAHTGRSILTMGRAGYDYAPLPTTLQTLKSTMNLVRGLDDGSVFVGMFDGLTASVSGQPSGVTLHSSTGSWYYDGTGSGDVSGTWRVRATKPDGTFLDSDICMDCQAAGDPELGKRFWRRNNHGHPEPHDEHGQRRVPLHCRSRKP